MDYMRNEMSKWLQWLEKFRTLVCEFKENSQILIQNSFVPQSFPLHY